MINSSDRAKLSGVKVRFWTSVRTELLQNWTISPVQSSAFGQNRTISPVQGSGKGLLVRTWSEPFCEYQQSWGRMLSFEWYFAFFSYSDASCPFWNSIQIFGSTPMECATSASADCRQTINIIVLKIYQMYWNIQEIYTQTGGKTRKHSEKVCWPLGGDI